MFTIIKRNETIKIGAIKTENITLIIGKFKNLNNPLKNDKIITAKKKYKKGLNFRVFI